MHRRHLTLLLALALDWTSQRPLAMAAETGREFALELDRFAEADRRQPLETHAVVFAGSSSIRLWTNLPAAFPGLTVLNRGFGGSTMRDLLQHFDRVIAIRQPRAVVVYEGDNDLAGQRLPDEIAREFGEFLDRMNRQLPGTPVLLLAVKPSPSRRSLSPLQRDLNQRLRALCASRPGVGFADTFAAVVDGTGEADPTLFEADRLHLNQRGYRAWTPVITRALKPLLDGPPTP